MTIHKEIEKKEYAKSPLGIVERDLTKVYDELKIQGRKLPENLCREIYKIREDNEKWQMKFIEDSMIEQRKKVDEKLLESMTAELTLIKSHGY